VWLVNGRGNIILRKNGIRKSARLVRVDTEEFRRMLKKMSERLLKEGGLR